ncbi:MAG: hemerythrin domain-containing protein [Acidimicrobiia bacterium]
MAGPMQMYLYVHDAILREVADLEIRAKELNRDDKDEVNELADRLGWFHMMVRKHEQTEEEVLFPALNERIRFVAETYQYDHDDFDAHAFSGVDDALAGLRSGGGTNQLKASAELLYRQNVALHEHMRLHISKENELLIPKLDMEFDVSEQAEIAGAMAGMVDPQLMGQLVIFMYRGQTLTDRVGMVTFLKSILPPEAYTNLSSGLEAIDVSAWAAVESRLPA